MVRRRFHPIIAFAAVIAAAGSVTAAGLTFTAHTVARTVAEMPGPKTRTLPSYVVRLPEAKAADLDISKTIEVKPGIRVPVSAPGTPANTPVAVAEAAPAAVQTPVAVAKTVPVVAKTPVDSVAEASPDVTELAPPTLIAEASPLSDEPQSAGDLYVVKSDVFVRSGPSKRYGQVGTVHRGTQLSVRNEDSGWLQVSFDGGSGWVYKSFVAPAGTGEVAEVEPGRAPF